MFYLNGAYCNLKHKQDLKGQDEIGLDHDGTISFDWFNMVGDKKRKKEFLESIKKNCNYIYYEIVKMVLSESLTDSLKAINYLFTNWHIEFGQSDIEKIRKSKVIEKQMKDGVNTLKDKVNSSAGKLSPVEQITPEEEVIIRKTLNELLEDWNNYNFS